MKTIIACILCVIIYQVTSEVLPLLENSSLLYAARARSICLEGEISGCSNDCKGRQFCMHGQEKTINCYAQTGKQYCNPKTLECVSSATSCDVEENPFFNCPGIGYYPHALNCSKFWLCSGDSTELLECVNSIFDPLEEKCSSNIPCYTFSPINGLCKGKEGAIVVHPLNKAIFAFCSGSLPEIGECPLNHIFNTNNLKCEFQCTAAGVTKDPMDEQCYYSCTKTCCGINAKHDCCKEGKIFNENLNACSPKKNITS